MGGGESRLIPTQTQPLSAAAEMTVTMEEEQGSTLPRLPLYTNGLKKHLEAAYASVMLVSVIIRGR